MAKTYRILDDEGNVLNTIVADLQFMEEHFTTYEEVIDPTEEASAARDEILRQLAEIDAKSDSPRARREAALGDTSYLQALETQAAALRAQLPR